MDEIDPNCLPPLPVPNLDFTSPPKDFKKQRIAQLKVDITNQKHPAFDRAIEYLKTIGDEKWTLIEGRYGKTQIRDVRIDLVSGEVPTTFEPGFVIKDGSLRQICHMHPLSPPTIEGSYNTVIYMHLFQQIPNLLRDLTKEIIELREENQKLKGE